MTQEWDASHFPQDCLLTLTGDYVKQWKEHFEEILNLNSVASMESEELSEALPIFLAEVV